MKDSLITPSDIARIEHLAVDRHGEAEIQWLCNLALRLAALKHTEAEFPAYLALINANVGNAYPMRLDGVMPPEEHELHWASGLGSVTLLERKLSCGATEAFLLVRPYVKLLDPQSEGTVEQLVRLGKITVRANDVVLTEGSIAEHLVGLNGYGFRRKPFVLSIGARNEKGIFGVGILDGDSTSSQGDQGVFLPSDTVVTVQLSYPLHRDEHLNFSTGLVMARYTTKFVECRPMPIEKHS